jgi:hypothetical protein
MTVTFRPATRENTPLVIGLAGPTKSGKTNSAHRLAVGLAQGKPIAMINTEGAKGHQYSDEFSYVTADLEAPFRPQRYTEALRAALALDPGVVIIDSLSHMHDGPGGILEWHEEELDRVAGTDQRKRERSTWTAWIRPKAAENQFIYAMLGANCHLILAFRAKEKLKIVTGKPPIDLGWQPIAGERVAFETIFTLVLPPHSKGLPDLSVSDMRSPFDTLIPGDKPLSEETGEALAKWAAGSGANGAGGSRKATIDVLEEQLLELADKLDKRDSTKAAITKHRKGAAPEAHQQWLVSQLARATDAVGELEKAVAAMSDGDADS